MSSGRKKKFLISPLSSSFFFLRVLMGKFGSLVTERRERGGKKLWSFRPRSFCVVSFFLWRRGGERKLGGKNFDKLRKRLSFFLEGEESRTIFVQRAIIAKANKRLTLQGALFFMSSCAQPEKEVQHYKEQCNYYASLSPPPPPTPFSKS